MADHGAASSSRFKYDVFLSFRGDTRFAFTDCLYHALINRRINTFRDDPNLRVGDEIRPTLFDAIEESRMSIVVLCQNYASSSWCLDELVKIMECSDKGRKRPILPIFYQVEPSDVRHQRNQYETAMIKHENGRNSHKVEAWRSALSAVGDLSGKHCTKNMYEGEIIHKIVVEVLEKLPPGPLYIKHSLGFDFQLEEVKSLLDIESRDIFCMLGIYGDGETQKTTFVVELYNKIRHQFEAASFLANVSEKSRESNGLEVLQKILLSEMGEEIKTDIGSTFKGSSEIKRWLGHKRVLLVLDDVDSIEQLDCLAGGGDWFGLGSRIIITTRNEDVLDKHALDGVENKKYCIDKGEFKGNKRRRVTEEEDMVGFVDNFNIVINRLKEEDSRSNVVSIIGMGGLGKTVLARKIYNNNEVKKLFPCRAWCFVSKDYKARNVLLSLFHDLRLSTSKFENSSEEDLKKQVRNLLEKKKFLVVLDDIWDTEVWDDVRGAFPTGNNESKILITSRNEMVAHYTSPKPPHNLPFLGKEESWELFCKKVFWGEECPNLERIGRSIVESCGGLPLAIVALAGLLAKKKRLEREWLRIKDYVRWHLAQDKTKVMDVLKLSYESLAASLKPCFLYFGIYPEDYEIPAKELIHLWIAEGFIQPQESGIPKSPKLEDVGEEYLDELADRSLIQVASTTSCGGVKTCRIHDLFHDLCILESKANKFLEVCTESNIQTLSNPHRLSLLRNAKSYISLIRCDQSNTHSLFLFAEGQYPDDTLKNFQSVHVLYLSDLALFKSVPSDLEVMIHLRYLKIEITSRIECDLDCIWTLQNLETLNLLSWRPFTVSNGIWELKQLRHVLLRLIAMLPAGKQVAENKIMWNLLTLYGVVFDQQMAFLVDDGNFPNMRKLGLLYLRSQKCSLYELLQSVHCLSNLRTLKLICSNSKLSLDAIVFPSNITKITFKMFCDLDSRSMSTLGQLPNLQCLKLYKGSIQDCCLNCATGEFPQLQVFHMTNICVESWRLEKGAMPRLQRLAINLCHELSELPEQLWSLTTLQQVHVGEPSIRLANHLESVRVKNGCKFIISDASPKKLPEFILNQLISETTYIDALYCGRGLPS